MSAFADFLGYQTGTAPAFLRGVVGTAWHACWGLMKDGWRIAASDAVTARFPLLAPEDALPAIAFERGLEAMPGENETAYRQRLVAAWSTWQQSGTIQGLANALILTGIPASQIVIAQRYASITSALTPPPAPPYPQIFVQTWASLPTSTSYLVAIYPPTAYQPEGVWGDGSVWGDGGTWGSTATLEQVNLIRRCIARYTPAHATCAGIVLVFTGVIPSTGAGYMTPSSWTSGGGVNGTAAYWLP